MLNSNVHRKPLLPTFPNIQFFFKNHDEAKDIVCKLKIKTYKNVNRDYRLSDFKSID